MPAATRTTQRQRGDCADSPVDIEDDRRPRGRMGGADMVTPTWERRPGAAPRQVHVSAPAHRGGVTELLGGLVPAQAATGLSVGWAVIGGDSDFFAFTRYLHQLLHGRADSQTVDRLAAAAPHYRSVLVPQAVWLAA